MANNKRSDRSSAVQAMKERFAEVAAVANKATYDRVSHMDALCEIQRLWEEIEQIMLTDEIPVKTVQVTQSGNPPHYYRGDKW